jgi:hypothetical protein
MRRSPIKRYAPPRKRRPGTRRGQPTAQEKMAVRLAVYERAQGRCEVRKHPECSGDRILPWGGDLFVIGHLAHIKSKGAGGEFTEENTVWSCWKCHLISGHFMGERMERSSKYAVLPGRDPSAQALPAPGPLENI